jgi:hypothetical protein
MNWTQRRAFIISVPAALFVAWLLYLGFGTSQDRNERTVTLTHMGLAAPCSEAQENFSLAARAGRGSDAAGLLTMLADGRLYEIEAGTRINASDTSDGMSVVYVESGPLLGKSLCMRTDGIR